jgi:hypothetical protein
MPCTAFASAAPNEGEPKTFGASQGTTSIVNCDVTTAPFADMAKRQQMTPSKNLFMNLSLEEQQKWAKCPTIQYIVFLLMSKALIIFLT